MANFFKHSGVYALVDGQFGSTGKGALAAYLAVNAIANDTIGKFSAVFSNAGPNSGHTFYGPGGEKIVLKQLPSFAVAAHVFTERALSIDVQLTAGAIIDPVILFDEARKFPGINIWVDPMAAVIRPEDKEAEHQGSVAAVAGTRSGTGVALANKVLRHPDAVFSWYFNKFHDRPKNVLLGNIHPTRDKHYFLEVSQGFSLGLNSEFYPKVTSRECTVMQGLADARIPAGMLAKTFMSIRSFPIRVGNVDGFSSGDCYSDQLETSWEDLGVEPELTTVTKRVRRVFTFSNLQLIDAVRANDPDYIFVNFLNYLHEEEQDKLVGKVHGIATKYSPTAKGVCVLGGYGPTVHDVAVER